MASWAAIARRIRVPLGFAFAVVYVVLAQPAWGSIILGSVIIVPGLIVRALASGHVQKNQQLTRSGPYACTRNPLYLGSLVLAAGFAVAARSWWIALGMLLIFAAIYWPVIRAEEAFLRQRFPEYADYARQVPRLLPRWSAAGAQGAFSAELYWQHREYNAVLGAVALLGILVAKVIWLSP